VAAGAQHTVTFRRADIFTVDLSPADIVTLDLLGDINEWLLPQLKQLKSGAWVASHEFNVPGRTPARTELVEYTAGMHRRASVWQAAL
jgi:hypothetical protein